MDAEIKEHEVSLVKLSEVKVDKSNPNKLTDSQMHGLHESMKRFGYLHPIILDQDNKIADGEHRYLVYKNLRIKDIPAYKVTLGNDEERRLLRQTMNKLRGEHDLQMDLEEIIKIREYDRLALEELIQFDDNKMVELENLVNMPTRDDWNKVLSENTNYAADGLSDLHTVRLIFTNSEFDLFNLAMQEIKPYKENDNTTLKIIKMINEWRVMRQQYKAEMKEEERKKGVQKRSKKRSSDQ